MKLAIGTIIMLLCFAEVAKAQSNDRANSARQVAAPVSESATGDYLVRDATPSQEAALRTQISLQVLEGWSATLPLPDYERVARHLPTIGGKCRLERIRQYVR